MVTAGGFANAGHNSISAELTGIGADLFEFRHDRSSLLPTQPLTPDFIAGLQAKFPDYPFALLRHSQVSIDGEEARLKIVSGKYFEVSGTRLAWGDELTDNGIFLGSELATRLYQGGSVSSADELSATYSGRSLGPYPVSGVALEPSVGNLESIQLATGDALLFEAQLPSMTVLRNQLFARLPDDSGIIQEVTDAINAGVPVGAAPYVAARAAASYQVRLDRLLVQEQRFQLAAMFVFLLASVGIATLLFIDAFARRKEVALARAFGSSRRRTLLRSVTRGAAVVASVAAAGTVIGIATYLTLAAQRGYAPVVPLSLIIGTVLGAIILGSAVAYGTGRWLVGQPPLKLLKGHA